MKPFELMTKKQVAALTGVNVSTVDRHVKAGRFPAPTYVFGRPRWRREDVERFLAQAFKPIEQHNKEVKMVG